MESLSGKDSSKSPTRASIEKIEKALGELNVAVVALESGLGFVLVPGEKTVDKTSGGVVNTLLPEYLSNLSNQIYEVRDMVENINKRLLL